VTSPIISLLCNKETDLIGVENGSASEKISLVPQIVISMRKTIA
jgi:hypothetical protein